MFDQLVQSNPHETAKQAGYFGITTLIYGAILSSVLIWSVFSFDLSSLNDGDLAYSELVAPIALPEIAPPPPLAPDKPQPVAAASSALKNVDYIKDPVLNINNSTNPPDGVLMVKSTATSVRVSVPFIKSDTNILATGGDPARTNSTATNNLPAIAVKQSNAIDETDVAPTVTPKVKPESLKKDIVVSGGVMNGSATSLPKPVFPAAARAIHASGEVKVQVFIDERGRVVSASAVSGHPLLRAAAQTAARQAVFTPTKLSNQPVKVNGVIVYNFVAQ